MDNSPSHKSLKIRDEISKTTNYLQFSVPYRPKTNAVESWFNQFKHYFRLSNNSAITYNELKEKVKKSYTKKELTVLEQEFLKKYFEKVKSEKVKPKKKQKI